MQLAWAPKASGGHGLGLAMPMELGISEIHREKRRNRSMRWKVTMTTAPRSKSEQPENTSSTSPTSKSSPSLSISGLRRSITPPPITRPLTPVQAALSFLDYVTSKRLRRDNIDAWIEQNLISSGFLSAAPRIHEPIFGALPTDKGCSPFLPESPPDDETSALLVRARARVIGHLQGLLQTPTEDRFMTAAIFSRRVRRVANGATMAWLPFPKNDDCVSDIITSLFVSDILSRREFYEQNLCICRHCGRVRFDNTPGIDRHRCFFC